MDIFEPLSLCYLITLMFEFDVKGPVFVFAFSYVSKEYLFFNYEHNKQFN